MPGLRRWHHMVASRRDGAGGRGHRPASRSTRSPATPSGAWPGTSSPHDAGWVAESRGIGRRRADPVGVRTLIEALAADGPIVIVVEDIHWAEPPLLDLLVDLPGRVRASGIPGRDGSP